MYLTRVWGYAVYIICFTIVTINFEDWADCLHPGKLRPIAVNDTHIFDSDGEEVEDEYVAIICRKYANYAIAQTMGLIMVVYSALYTFILMKHEFHQLRLDGLRVYIQDVWNWLDFLAAVFTSVSLVWTAVIWVGEVSDREMHRSLDIVQAHALLLGWIKVLYFLRGLDQTSFLVNMLLQIIRDMSSFLIVLLVVLVAFASSFHLMLRHDLIRPDKPNGEEEEIMYDHTLTSIFGVVGMMFGAFEVTDFRQALSDSELLQIGPLAAQESASWVSLFDLLVFLVAVPLVMLNALIAIMSDTYNRVKSDAEAAKIHDRAELILEMEG